MSDFISRQDALKAVWKGQMCAAVAYGRTDVAKMIIEETVTAIAAILPADVVKVVRCKDCKYLEKSVGMVEGEPVSTMHLCRRYPVSVETTPYGFCDRGERREG